MVVRSSELLSTDDVAPDERFAYWREVVCAVFVPLGVERLDDTELSGSVEVRRWHDLALSHVTSTAQVVTHSAADPLEDCLISIQLRGRGRISQDGRVAELRPGRFALYDATRPYELVFDDDFEQLVVQFPREELLARNVVLGDSTALAGGDGGLGAVATGFVRSLAEHGDDVPDQAVGRLGSQALDCLAAALGELAGAPSLGAATASAERQRVLDHIDAHLADPSLTVTTLAAALGRSTRSLQKLFEGDELHLSERIRRARLARARAVLVDPLAAHRPVAAVAASVGLPDPAHFSRLFRSRYGCSPSELRTASRISSPPS
ncbi:MAG: AraC family transcriptional regulator [Actinomycetota bacterium]